MGFGETPAYPALVYLLSCWIPKSERGRVSSIVFCGGQVYRKIFSLPIFISTAGSRTAQFLTFQIFDDFAPYPS